MDMKRKARISALEEMGDMLDSLSMNRAKGYTAPGMVGKEDDKYAPMPGHEADEDKPVNEDFNGMNDDDLERIKAKLKELE